jgi:Tc toxin complex TcA C-terminal TcB-binding domain/Neuraminidase-like domain/Salmonella virulence plasmid 28.1kDa A protein
MARFEHDGISVWYETDDAPAPQGDVPAGIPLSVTVGVSPPDAGNAVEIVYSVNGGSDQSVQARWIFNSQSAQYFRARLPDFRTGDYVSYAGVCSCSGRHVPSGSDLEGATSSFVVVKVSSQEPHVVDRHSRAAPTDPVADLTQPTGIAPVRSMRRDELLRLDAAAELSLLEVQEADPTIATELRAQASLGVRAVVDEHLRDASPELRAAVERVAATPLGGDVWDDILGRLEGADVGGDVLEEARAVTKPVATTDERQLLRTDEPIAANPLFAGMLAWARMHRLATIAGVPEAPTDALLRLGGTPDQLDDMTIDELITKGELSTDQGRRLGFVTTLYRFLDRDPGLTERLQVALDAASEGLLEDVRRLVTVTEDRWRELIETSALELSGALGPAEYARQLRRRFEAAFPTDALFARVESRPLPLVSDLAALDAALASGTSLSGGDSPDLSAIPEAERDAVQVSYATVRATVNAFPGLRLAELFEQKDVPAEQRLANVQGRVNSFLHIADVNPHLELLNLDYSPGSTDLEALSLDGVPADEREGMIGALKAYQRGYSLTNDVTDASALVMSGYDSASRIVGAGFPQFAKDVGLELGAARRYFDAALAAITPTVNTVSTVLEVIDSGFSMMTVSMAETGVAAHFRRINGYEDLFGQQDYCRCEHCSSLLSPAAYFVDLMRFVERSILAPSFGNRLDDPFHLRSRRPDLWYLELTCANTDTEVPVLEIVNEILENNIATRTSYAGSLIDRVAVWRSVYGRVLANANDSFKQPFNLPLERLRTYLAHFGVSRGDIAALIGATLDIQAAATLGLSESEYKTVTTANKDPVALAALYDIALQVRADGLVEPFDVQQLLRAVDVARPTLSDLLATRSVGAGGAMRVQGERTDSQSVQNDIERVHDARTTSLDVLHRFTRLYRSISALENGPSWSPLELDLVLQTLGPTLNAPTLQRLAAFVRLEGRLRLGVEELVALVDAVPTTPTVRSGSSMFDLVFNLADFVRLDGRLPKDTARFVVPALRAARAPGDPPASPDYTLPRLLAGLRVDADTLDRLVRGLGTALKLQPEALTDPPTVPEPQRGFLLSHENLSVLYRHARLAELLGVDVPTLFRLIELVPGIAGTAIASLEDVWRLTMFWDWVEASPYNLDDLTTITRPAPALPGRLTALDVARRVAERVRRDGTLLFTDTLFAYIDGVTEERSRQIFAANPSVAIAGGDGRLRVAAAFDASTPLTLPPSVPPTAVRDILLARHPQTVIPTALSSELGLDVPKTTELLRLTSRDLRAPELFAELLGTGSTPVLNELCRLIVPLSTAFKDESFDANAVSFVRQHREIFHLTAIDPMPVTAVHLLATYSELSHGGQRGSEIQAVLGSAFKPDRGFAAETRSTLAAMIDSDLSITVALQANLSLPENPLAALAKLRDCAKAAAAIGIDGRALTLIVSDNYAELDEAANAVLAAFRAKYSDDAAWRRVIEPFEAQLLNRRRDALAEWLIRSSTGGYHDRADLYRYFLLDIDADGILSTSRLVSALGTLQLYIHRVQMNLEQAADGSSRVRPGLVRPEEWNWRKHYRVWEASRRVFLWPENYLVPNVRDDKTPLFEELEDGLLQSELDEHAVLEAYVTYASGFREVANLAVAGAYHDFDDAAKRDTLHVIGVTPGDPPRFYHRTVEGSRLAERMWGRHIVYRPWRPIDVTIPVRDVAPVVHNNRLHIFWVEITSLPQNELSDGGSRFVGYKHKLAVKLSSLRLDGTWTPAQRLDLSHTTTYSSPPFYGTDGTIDDPLIDGPIELEAFHTELKKFVLYGLFTERNIDQKLQELQKHLFTPRYDVQPHMKPLDGYTLRGAEFSQVYPKSQGQRLVLTGANFAMRVEVDLVDRIARARPVSEEFLGKVSSVRFPAPLLVKESWDLYSAVAGDPWHLPDSWDFFDDYAFAVRIAEWRWRFYVPWFRYPANPDKSLLKDRIADIDPNARLVVVNGSVADGILSGAPGDVYLLQFTGKGGYYALRRLSTTVASDAERRIATSGVRGLLELTAQQALTERPSTVVPVRRIDSRSPATGLDFRGAFGTYFRELFLHIPLLVADNLNGQQRFEEARRWYEHVFDPTAEDPYPGPFGPIACAAGDLDDKLHLVGLTSSGGVEHTLQRRDGTWLGERLDVKTVTSDPGSFQAVACAGAVNALHVCGVTTTGGLFHVLRHFDGSWQRSFGDVKAATGTNPGRFSSVACAVDRTGILHVCATTVDGGIWHTLRHTNGSWQPSLGSVKAAARSDPGEARSVACAVDLNNALHVCAATTDGSIWHTLRNQDGSWQHYFGSVKAVTSDPGVIRLVACATDRDSVLHVCAVTDGGALWHTLRRADGTWQGFFGDVRAAAGSPGALQTVACACDRDDNSLHVLGVVEGTAWGAARDSNSWRPFRRTGFNERDRNWRYREFRGLGVTTLRQILTDGGAIEAYRQDPFNPHAVARLRLTAYQKAVVMRYIDNLFDHADELFARYEMETVNEAMILYATAADILGERPVEVGSCSGQMNPPRSYEALASSLDKGTEFLAEVEHWTGPAAGGATFGRSRNIPNYVVDETVLQGALSREALAGNGELRQDAIDARGEQGVRLARYALGRDDDVGVAAVSPGSDALSAHFAEALVRQIGPAFCVPRNPMLLGYWDRLEDRLSKIRHGMDITGTRRKLSLFSPEIEAAGLVRQSTVTLSSDDVLDTLGGERPPYRFEFLIAKAKESAASVQALGSALLEALERKETEQLNDLRTVHQDQLLQLSRDVRQWEYAAAAASAEALNRRRTTIEHRRDYYKGLTQGGLNAAEWAQRISQHVAAAARSTEATLHFLGGVLHLIPEMGSPFAMKYGGKQMGSSMKSFGDGTMAIGDAASTMSTVAAMEAGFARRNEEWSQQLRAAQDELEEVAQQIAAAIRQRDMAERAIMIHQRSVEQTKEIFDFARERFTRAGLYSWQSTQLQRLHREAFSATLTIARMAERAFRFERDDVAGPLLSPDHWETGRAGLLSGARLANDLRAMERRFLETDDRQLEIDQTFSIAQIDPAAVIQLRETGRCTFKLPELFFNLTYPGQYRRRIKMVRVTIPSVTGSNTNVGATLTLIRSELRRSPSLGEDGLVPMPVSRTVSIATSSGRSDPGVWEASIRAERYMPFEGAGAVNSEWELTMPANFRPFDYASIPDVLVHVAYTARYDSGLRTEVETESEQTVGSIFNILKVRGLRRLFSMRHEFPDEFSRLLAGPAGTTASLRIGAVHFPFFAQGKPLLLRQAMIAIQLAEHSTLAGTSLTVNQTPVTDFGQDLGGLPAAKLSANVPAGVLGRYEIAVGKAGALAPPGPREASGRAIAEGRLLDLLLYLDYTVEAPKR